VSLHHYKARAYAPALGRFPQTDPIGLAGGLNRYASVGNNPVRLNNNQGKASVLLTVKRERAWWWEVAIYLDG
jgi:uncharacterized protein RhaS with RHS repeats